MGGFTRKTETDIAAPAGQIYAYLADLTKHPEWADQEMTIKHVAGPLAGPGATFRTHVEIDLPVGYSRDDATVVVQQAISPRHLAYDATDSGGHYRWTIDLTDNGGTTHVEQRVERLDGPLWVRVTQPALWKAFGGRMVENGLANLKQRMESPGR